MEDCFMIVCRGLSDECEAVWLVPVSELKGEMKLHKVKTFRELADSFMCDSCRAEMNAEIIMLERMNDLPQSHLLEP